MKKVLTFFWSIQKSEKMSVFLSLAIAIATPLLGDVIAPRYYANLSKAIANNTSFPITYNIALIFIGLIITKFIVWRLGNYMIIVLQQKTMQELADYSAHHLLGLPPRFFKNSGSSVGAIVGKHNKLVKAYEKIYDDMFYHILPSIVIFICIIPILIMIMPVVGSIMICIGILFALMTYRIARWMSPANEELSQSDSRVTNLLADQLSNINTIHTFGQIEREKKRFSKANSIRAEKRKTAWLKGYIHWSANDIIQVSMVIATVLISLYYWEQKYFSIGEVILLNSYVISLSSKLSTIGNVIKNVQGNVADAKEMIAILEYQSPILNNGTQQLLSEASDITFDNVTFGYDEKRPIFKNLSLTIKKGEKVAIVGPSGSGKSTLIELIMRNIEPQSGTVSINNIPLPDIALSSLQQHIALVPQEPSLFNRSIASNIKYANPHAEQDEVEEAAKKAQAHKFILTFKNPKKNLHAYSYLAGEKGNKLSGGQKQRIAIAAALFAKRNILILDEATSSLDSHSEMAIQEAINDIKEDRNTTMVVIAHRLSTVKAMDKILYLKDGKVLEEGSHEELMVKNGAYADLVAAQAL